jgi:hypothetical protein
MTIQVTNKGGFANNFWQDGGAVHRRRVSDLDRSEVRLVK